MKKKLVILLAALLTVSAVAIPSAKALDFSISIDDTPYYEGPNFWDYGWYYVWVPGHRYHHHWVHGYYVRRGEWNRRHAREHHGWGHHHHRGH